MNLFHMSVVFFYLTTVCIPTLLVVKQKELTETHTNRFKTMVDHQTEAWYWVWNLLANVCA